MADQLLTPAEFAQTIKAKHPDYASVPDDVLAAKMLEKYPEYRDRVRTSPSPSAPAVAEVASPTMLDTANDVVRGAAKGVGNTVFGLGKAVHDYTPVGRISDAILPGAFDQRPPEIVPTNTAQKIGFGAEQIGEFFLPTGTAGAVGKFVNAPRLIKGGAEVAKASGLTLAQTGSPTAAGVSGAITAAMPVVGGAVGKLVAPLKAKAAKQVVQALGPTKERFKAMAERLAPEILKRGLRGSRDQLLEKAVAAAETSGQQIDDAIQQFGARQVDATPVVAALETAKDAFRTTVQRGTKTAFVEYEPRAIRQLDTLQKVVTDLGPDARVDQLIAVRRAWDKVVSDAGGFAHRAGGAIGVPLKDQSEAAAKREATTAIRKLLDAEVPELSVLNKEFAFWKGMEDVLEQTQKRTQPHGQSLKEGLATATGAVAASSHGLAPAVMMGYLAKKAHAVFTSPRWALASAQTKDALADALVSGKPAKVANALGKLASAGPGQLTPAVQGK